MRLTILLFAIACSSLFARADSIDYSGAGSLADHTAVVFGAPVAGKTWSVTTELVEIDNTTTGMIETGNLGHVDITTGTLSACGTALCFTGGSLDITSSNGTTIFDMSFTNGTVLKLGGNTYFNATLTNGGTTMIASNTGSFSSDSVINGVSTTTPESSSLFLLGTGLVGLWWLGREKLKDMGE